MKRIVVGVDDSPGSDAALRWALKLAGETGAVVEALHTWELPYQWIDGGYWPNIERWCAEAARAAQERLDRAIANAVEATANSGNVTPLVAEGQAAQTLIDRSREADLLVVGSRGRGGFTGLLLGSVSQQCVHYSHVPVVVIPNP